MHIPEPNDRQFELAPAGTHMAVAYRVIDLGTQTSSWNGQPKRQHKILISWELPDEKMADGRPFTIGQRYTWSMSEKAALRRDLESWRGTPFTEKDFGQNGFDIKNIIGKACLLNVIHAEKNGKQYANIASISRLMKGQQGPPQTANEQVYLWINNDRWEPSTYQKLSDGLKALIAQSPEYHAIVNGYDDGSDEPPPVDAHDAFGDEIPF